MLGANPRPQLAPQLTRAPPPSQADSAHVPVCALCLCAVYGADSMVVTNEGILLLAKTTWLQTSVLF